MLTDLRIVLEPYCEESDIELRWTIPDELPLVQADRHSLLQVLLNVTKNSQRALESVARKVDRYLRLQRSRRSLHSDRRQRSGNFRRDRNCFNLYKEARTPPDWDCTCRAPLCDRFAETCAMTRITPAVVLSWSWSL